MATTPLRSGSDAAPPSTFSYAQAAKGIAPSSASTGPTSKAPSGTITPAKDAAQPTNGLPASPPAVTEDTDSALKKVQKELEKPSVAIESLTNGDTSHGKHTGAQQQEQPASSVAQEHKTDASSVPEKDDASTNESMDTSWENKSQDSTLVGKPNDQEDGLDELTKKGQPKEKIPVKPLHEAPPPSVNIWKQRADEAAKSKTATMPTAAKTVPSITPAVPSSPASKPGIDKNNESAKADSRRKMDDKAGPGRRDTKPPRLTSRDDASAVAPPPPTKDEESWPTPHTIQEDDRKKPIGKGEKDDKERSTAAAASRAHGRSEWVSIPFIPTVVFNTPLPNASNRRGGARGGSRGGSQATSRSGPYNTSASEKDSTSPTTVSGETAKRDRNDGSSARDRTPEKTRRAVSAGPPSTKEAKHSSSYTERGNKPNSSEGPVPKAGDLDDWTNSYGASQGANGNSARQNSSHRQKQSRKFDGPTSERGADNTYATPNGTASSFRNDERKPATSVDGGFAQSKSGRNGHFNSFNGRERGEGRGRGVMRGRGGQHPYPNSTHQNSHAAPGGHHQSIPSGSFSQPRSPTSYSEQSTYFNSQPQQQRSYRGNGPRPQSMAMDNGYGRGSNGFHPTHQLAPIQTYMPSPYDYQGMPPMSAMPYGPMVESMQLLGMITMQLEYYFSVENLIKDLFMRKHMDSQGFVYLDFIADFNRIKQLCPDLEMIKYACYQSRLIEYRLGSDGKHRLRRREGWEQWILTKSERDPSAQNDGTQDLHAPPVPHPQAFESQSSMRGPPSAPPLAPSNGLYEKDFHLSPNGVGSHQSTIGLDTAKNAQPFTPPSQEGDNQHKTSTQRPSMNPEADSFSDEQIENLRIVIGPQGSGQAPQSAQPKAPFPSMSSRTFSNGSIDGQNPVEEHQSLNRPNGTQVNGHVPMLGDERRASLALERTLSPPFTDQSFTITPFKVFWVKDKHNNVESLPAGADSEDYLSQRKKALEQRQITPIGSSPYDMDILYSFWSHFLIRNFNTHMYDEFRYCALKDVNERSSDTGIKNLIKYYGEALSNQITIRQRIAHDYVGLVRSENQDGERPAFKQLRSAWRNGALNMKNRKKISDFVDPDLKAELES